MSTSFLPNQDASIGVSESVSCKLCLLGKPVSAAIMMNGNELHRPISNSNKFSTLVATNYKQSVQNKTNESIKVSKQTNQLKFM